MNRSHVLYRINFLPQSIYAESIEDAVEKVNRFKDSIPFSVSTTERQVAQWRKHEGIRLIEPMKICKKHNRQLDTNGICRDCDSKIQKVKNVNE